MWYLDLLRVFTARDYDLRCQLGTADPTKKKFLHLKSCTIHTTYIYIYTYIQFYVQG